MRGESDRTRPRAGFIAMSTLMLWLSTAIASAAFWPSYGSVEFVIMAAVTTVVGSLVAILGAVFRWRSPLVLAATILVYLLLGVPLAIPRLAIGGFLPSLGGLQELVVATATSWKQLLTISLPVGSYESLLVPAFLVVLVAVVVSLSVALRSRYGELGVLGPVAVFLVALLFGPAQAPFAFPVAIGLTASILLWLVWRRWYRRRESIRLLSRREVTTDGKPIDRVADGGFVGLRTVASAVVILSIAGAAAYGATRILPPATDRVVLRTTIVQPFDPRDYPSPLSGFRKYLQPTTADLKSVV